MAAHSQRFSSTAFLQAYTGILGLEIVDGADSLEHRTILSQAVAALRKTLELEHGSDVALAYLTDAAERYPELQIDAYSELVQFTTRNPNNPFGRRLLFDYLRRHDRRDDLFDAGAAVLALDPASSVFDDLLGAVSDGRRLARLCIDRLQYTLYDLPAWTTLSALLPRSKRGEIAPDLWWLDMHYRHPRALARELGLPGRMPAPDDVLQALVYKTICAAYLLDDGPESRFVLVTIQALNEAGQMPRVELIFDGIAAARKRSRR